MRSRAERSENPFSSKHFGPRTPAITAPPGYTRPGTPMSPSNPVPRGAGIPTRRKPIRRLVQPGSTFGGTPISLPNRPIFAPSLQPTLSQQCDGIPPLPTPPTKQNPAKRTQMAATASHQRRTAIRRLRPRGKARRKQEKIRAKPCIECGSGPRGKSRGCCKLMHGITAAGGYQTNPIYVTDGLSIPYARSGERSKSIRSLAPSARKHFSISAGPRRGFFCAAGSQPRRCMTTILVSVISWTAYLGPSLPKPLSLRPP